jgi:hypothetical protein
MNRSRIHEVNPFSRLLLRPLTCQLALEMGGSPRAMHGAPHHTEGVTQMTQSQKTAAADPARQAAYRRLALTILALDVPTLAARLQVARPQAVDLLAQRQTPQAA